MIPIFKPYMPKIEDIDVVLHSGELAYGHYTSEFENRLKGFFDTPYLIVTNSYNNAISVALSTLGIKHGSGVIMSPMTCLASTQAFSNGLKVCWADVDPTTGTLAPESVEKHITSETKAIIHNHYCGYPGYIDEINSIGKRFGIPVIDDGIECLGSEYKGHLIGNCGTDVTIFSLTAVRFCNCIDGGIVIFKNKELYDKSLLIRDCGIDRSSFRDGDGEISSLCDIKLVGYSAMMSNVNGYIGLKQMDNLKELLKKHRQQATKWTAFFKNHATYTPLFREDCNPNYWIYGILTKDKRNTIKEFRRMGYYASGIHIRNDIYSLFGNSGSSLPGVAEFNKSFVGLPCGWWMSCSGE